MAHCAEFLICRKRHEVEDNQSIRIRVNEESPVRICSVGSKLVRNGFNDTLCATNHGDDDGWRLARVEVGCRNSARIKWIVWLCR